MEESWSIQGRETEMQIDNGQTVDDNRTLTHGPGSKQPRTIKTWLEMPASYSPPPFPTQDQPESQLYSQIKHTRCLFLRANHLQLKHACASPFVHSGAPPIPGLSVSLCQTQARVAASPAVASSERKTCLSSSRWSLFISTRNLYSLASLCTSVKWTQGFFSWLTVRTQ